MIRSKIRLYSGLILSLFLTMHFMNHSVGLYSIEAMDIARPWFHGIWHTAIGGTLLILGLAAHSINALISIYQRSSFRMSKWEFTQSALGFAASILIASHLAYAFYGEEYFEYDVTYTWIITYFWIVDPIDGIIQGAALLVAWVHGSIGIHYWLRTKPAYEKWFPATLAFMVALPVAAAGGYISAGFDVFRLAEDPAFVDLAFRSQNLSEEAMQILPTAVGSAPFVALSALGVALLASLSKQAVAHLKTQPKITLPTGKAIRIPPGGSLLEAMRAARIPHASVCGGRGRCTTCRVRITQGLENLEPADGIEAVALKRIKAPDSVRLACQINPTEDISVLPLLPPEARNGDKQRLGGVEGNERAVTFMFIDMRGSTKLGETKLPFDVLFILNQFFAEMTAALHETNGHYAQFNGDGLMAIYGLEETDPAQGIRDALAGAAAMLRRLDGLNEALKTELPFPLTMGIGINYGEAIVGAMGPPDAQILSAVGDVVNTAARLESLSKGLAKPVIVAKDALDTAGITLPPDDLHEQQLRGRGVTTQFYALDAPPAVQPVS